MEKALSNDTLEIAYKILYRLEHERKSEFMGELISPERLKADPEKWLDVIQTLEDEGYISGVSIRENICGEICVDVGKVKITLSGAQYLKENSAMARFAKLAGNVITVVKP